MPYNPTAIEKKWQQYWLTNKSFAAYDPADAGSMPKAYVLDMFPYPSGAGLHVGHPEGYTATDIVSRYLRAKGFNVLHPMGWDAFGLPAEQYAIKNNVHPAETTKKNIDNFRRQIQMLGLSYDWDREVDTTDPKYYKWTQWIFLQLFNSYFDPIDQKAKPIGHLINELENENLVVAPDGSVKINPTQEGLEEIAGEIRVERLWRELTALEKNDVIAGQRLAYMDEVPVNWCPGLGTVLANEEVIDGKSEVGQFPVERRPMRQWMLRISAYSDRLLKDLDLLQWPESLKEMQRNWIGRSTGAEVDFDIDLSGVEHDKPTDARYCTRCGYALAGLTDLSKCPACGQPLANVGNGATQPPVAQGSEPQPPAGAAAEGVAAAVEGDDDLVITVFTTRPDTLYGATYMVMAPEHPLVDRITPANRRETVDAYRTMAASKSDRDRMEGSKDKTGCFIGAHAINPINDERLPIYIADYVMMGYGTGAIMAVPGHDERDFEFAKKFDLPIKLVVGAADGTAIAAPFVGEGVAVNSPIINGLKTAEAKERITEALGRDGVAVKTTKYKLRDWLFSRQRYWGEPFPILHDRATEEIYALDESPLPLKLPEVEDFRPRQFEGDPDEVVPPLGRITEWQDVWGIIQADRTVKVVPEGTIDAKQFRRELNVMPQWAGSCWYYLRYIDPANEDRFVDPAKEKYWMPVDLYVGGVEHAVLHLLYARFWHKVLFDLGHVATAEPFQRLVNQGLILATEYYVFETAAGQTISATDVHDIKEEATDQGPRTYATHKQTGEKLSAKLVPESSVTQVGDKFVLQSDQRVITYVTIQKMSKSRKNVVNPDDIVKDYGADAFRLYEMYMGPLEAQKPWTTRDIVGMTRFLGGVWNNLANDEEKPVKIEAIAIPDAVDRLMHKTIKKVGEDIEALRFNTAIAELIVLNKEIGKLDVVPRELAENFVLMLAPFAPHIAEEIWNRLAHTKSLTRRPWPSYDPAKLVESTLEIPVQVNGKLRDKITVPADMDSGEILFKAAAAEKVKPWLEGKVIKKKLYVPKKLVNFVVGD